MVDALLVPLALGLALTLVGWGAERFARRLERYHASLVSFGGGAIVSILFLAMLPEVQRSPLGPEWALAGFALFHLAHKYAYQHAPAGRRKLPLSELETAGFFLAYFLAGSLVAHAYLSAPLRGLALLVPLAVHKVAMGILYFHATDRVRLPAWQHWGVVLATILGSGAALLFYRAVDAFGAFSAFTTGAFLYIVTRDLLPPRGLGKTGLFAAGVLFAALVDVLLLGA